MALGHVVTRGYGTGTLAGDVNLVVVRGFTAGAAVASITLSTGLTDEASVVSGGSIVLTVSDDTWVATVGADNAITTALIAGITADGVEATGWNALVRDALTFAEVTRDSDTQVTVTIAAAGYDITAIETVTATIAATALTGAVETVATPTFDITVAAAAEESSAGGGSAYAEPRRRVDNRISDGLFDGFEPFKEPETAEEAPKQEAATTKPATPVKSTRETLGLLDDLSERRAERARLKALEEQRKDDAAKLFATLEADRLRAEQEQLRLFRLRDQVEVQMLMEAAQRRRDMVIAYIQGRNNG